MFIEELRKKIKSFERIILPEYSQHQQKSLSVSTAIEFLEVIEKHLLYVNEIRLGENREVIIELKLKEFVFCKIYFNSDGSNEIYISEENESLFEGTLNDFNKILEYRN